jgi:hypothetical protein
MRDELRERIAHALQQAKWGEADLPLERFPTLGQLHLDYCGVLAAAVLAALAPELAVVEAAVATQDDPMHIGKRTAFWEAVRALPPEWRGNGDVCRAEPRHGTAFAGRYVPLDVGDN